MNGNSERAGTVILIPSKVDILGTLLSTSFLRNAKGGYCLLVRRTLPWEYLTAVNKHTQCWGFQFHKANS